jgi:uncharacterized SAM-binding protein YcdF (DUF218 family)
VFLARLAINEHDSGSVACADAARRLFRSGGCDRRPWRRRHRGLCPQSGTACAASFSASNYSGTAAPLLVITGGSRGEHCPVADAMAQLARDSGVPADKIMLERQSLSTRENSERTAPLLRERNVNRILLVTDRLHMRRAAGVFRHLVSLWNRQPCLYEGHVDNVSMLSMGIREAAALAYYQLRGWTAPLKDT